MQNIHVTVDCLEHIFAKLSFRQREKCREVCRQWLEAVKLLDRGQKSIHIYEKTVWREWSSPESQSSIKYNNDWENLFTDKLRYNNTQIIWPTNYISFDSFCRLLDRFSNIEALKFVGINHWNDHLLRQLAKRCPQLTQLSFVQCLGLGRSRMCEKNDHMNVTISGWAELINRYGQQVTKLSLWNCDLNEQQLKLIVQGFRVLTYLDIGSNRIGDASVLKYLCPSIQVLSVGPRLSASITTDIPIESIVNGPGKYVRELHLQGFLSPKLSLISTMPNLETLVLRFAKPYIEDSALATCFASIGQLKKLKRLELHEHNNNHDCHMTIGREQMFAILKGCSSTLEHLRLHCDPWCDDTPIDDELIARLSKQCHRLRHLDLCPGNIMTSDNALQCLSTMPSLEHLRLGEFSAITERGVLSMLSRSKTIRYCILDNCCDVNVQNVFQTISQLNASDPERRLELSITPLSSLHMSTEILHCPNDNHPQMTVKICGKKARLSDSSSKWSLFGLREAISGLVSHLSLAFELLFTFTSTLLKFFIVCLFYGILLGLLMIKNRRMTEWMHFSPIAMSTLQINLFFVLLAMTVIPFICLLISFFT